MLVETRYIGAVPSDWTDILIRATEGLDAHILLVRAALVRGRLHAVSAVEHADRAFDRRRNRARTPEIECLLYLLGERQIARAVRIAAPGDENALIAWGEGAMEALVRAIDLLATPDRGPLPETVSDTFDALERTAMADLEK